MKDKPIIFVPAAIPQTNRSVMAPTVAQTLPQLHSRQTEVVSTSCVPVSKQRMRPIVMGPIINLIESQHA